MNLSEKLTIVGLVFNFLGVSATAIGFYLVVRQINLSRAVAKAGLHRLPSRNGRFLLHLQKIPAR